MTVLLATNRYRLITTSREGHDVYATDSFAMLVFLILAVGTAAAEPTYRVFVTNERDDSVSVIDSRTNEVEATIDVGDRPRGIGFSPDRAYVYVALGEENAIGVIDARTLEVVKRYRAGSIPRIRGASERQHLSVNEDANLATVLNPVSGDILAEIPVASSPKAWGCRRTAHGSW